MLSHDEHEIRAIAAGCADVLAFRCVRGTWISEELEPVTIAFEWQRRDAPAATSEDDCVCPTELAARLIQTLFGGGGLDTATGETLYVFRPERNYVATFGTERQSS